MINLLPPSEKKLLRIEMIKRIILIHCFLALFFIVCLILILLSIKFYTKGEIDYLKTYNKEIKEEEPGMKDFESKISLFNSSIEELKRFYQNKIYFNQIIEKVSIFIPEGAYLKRIQIIPVPESKEVFVSVFGFIKDRESLFNLKKSLEADKNIKDIVFPPSSWIKPFDIDFSATFKVI